jgi:hypothetical protein
MFARICTSDLLVPLLLVLVNRYVTQRTTNNLSLTRCLLFPHYLE